MIQIYCAVMLMVVLSVTNAENAPDVVSVFDKSFPKLAIFDAQIDAINQSTVSSRIAAEVTSINFDVGDFVPKDAILMTFRDEEFRARVAQIEANLTADKAAIQEADARLVEATSEAKRVSNLFKSKLVSQSALDKANADLAVTQARVHVLNAQIKSRLAQLDEANVNLSYTEIRAPYSGVVTERLIELGEMASPGQHVMTGLSLEELRATAFIPQYQVATVSSARHATITFNSGRTLQSDLITLVPNSKDALHSYEVRVILPAASPDFIIYPGMFVKLAFHVGDEAVRVVPKSAILQRGELSAVYVLTNGQALLRQVRLGRMMTDDDIEIIAGLEEGELIAVNPLHVIPQQIEKSR
jgi:RND family efflux transporter MFP subunit